MAQKAAAGAGEKTNKTRKEPEVSPEHHFTTCFLSKPEEFVGEGMRFAMGGSLKNEHGSTTAYEKVFYTWPSQGRAKHWKTVLGDDMSNMALNFLGRDRPSRANSRTAKACVETLGLALVNKPEFHLPQRSSQRTAIVPVLDHYVLFDAQGEMSVVPQDASWGLTYCVNAALDPEGLDTATGRYTPRPLPEHSLFKKFLDRIQPDLDLQEVLQEAMGSTLLPYGFQKSFWFKGEGSNGKSTLLEIVSAFHPSKISFDLAKLNSAFAMKALVGKTLVLVPELSAKGFDQEKFKALVSRDLCAYEEKWGDTMDFRPTATFILSLNNMPSVSDQSHGFWRRLMTFPFDQRLAGSEVQQDFHRLITDNPQEMGWVLGWLLAGAQRLVKRGRFPDELPASMTNTFVQQKLQTDSVFAFTEDFPCRPSATTWADKGQVYEAYKRWCLTSSRQPLSVEKFWQRLREHIKQTQQLNFEERKVRAKDGTMPRRVGLEFDGLPEVLPIQDRVKPQVESVSTNILPFRSSKVVAEAAPAEPVARVVSVLGEPVDNGDGTQSIPVRDVVVPAGAALPPGALAPTGALALSRFSGQALPREDLIADDWVDDIPF